MKKGFTLVELLIVIIIIGILATMAVPQYNKMVGRARSVEGIGIVGSILSGQLLYYTQYGWNSTNNNITAYVSDLDVEWDTVRWDTNATWGIAPASPARPTYYIRVHNVANTRLQVRGNINCTSGSKTIYRSDDGNVSWSLI